MIGKLGKRPAVSDPRTLRLAKYTADLPPAPPTCDWSSGITDWGMMQNDVLGDCTIAACGHAMQTWSAATGPEFTATDDQVVSYYSQWCGYVPGNSATDQGGIELDVLNRWRSEGFLGNKLIAYADPDPGNGEHIRQAVANFGGVYLGVALPTSAAGRDEWIPLGLAGSWGGHAVFANKYDEQGLWVVTWGKLLLATWDFILGKDKYGNRYCDEAHCLLSQMWLDRAPSAFKLGDLQSDLAAVTG